MCVAGGVAGLAGLLLALPGAVALGMLAANILTELQRSTQTGEPMAWRRALTKGLVAATIAFVALALSIVRAARDSDAMLRSRSCRQGSPAIPTLCAEQEARAVAALFR